MLKTEIDDLEKYAIKLQNECEKRDFPYGDPEISIPVRNLLKLVAYVRKLERVRAAAIFYNDHVAINLPTGKSATIEYALIACDGDDSE